MEKSLFIVPFDNGSGEKSFASIYARNLSSAMEKAKKFAKDFDMKIFYAEIRKGIYIGNDNEIREV